MREGPDIAHIASLVGDPARANMLTALIGGTALTASELALEAGVTLPTASSHLAKLTAGGLLKLSVQGRHRYFALAGPHIAAMLEGDHGRGGDGRAAARAPRAARQGDARGARLLRPPRRRSCRGDVRRLLARGRDRSIRRRRSGSAATRAAFFAARGIDIAALSRPAPAGLPRLPRLERAALASRRLAGRGDPRQGVRREMGAARERRPGGELLAEGQAGFRAHVPGGSRSCTARIRGACRTTA